MTQPKLFKVATLLSVLVLVVVILIYAKPFLVPIVFAGLLAMLLLPVMRWLRSKGIGEAVSIVLSILLLILFVGLIVFFIGWQLSDIAEDASKLEQQISSKYKQLQEFVSHKFGIPTEKQDQMIKEQQSAAPGKLSGMITGFLSGFAGLLADSILILVYIFLFMYFRGKLKNFLMKLVPGAEQKNAMNIVDDVQRVSRKYINGLAFMIVLLWIMYGIGFSIAGVENALFFAVLCGILEIIPFIGNITGTALTLSMSLVQGGGSSLFIGILVTYVVVQFIQTYIIEPLVVGSEVNINPLFTILGLVAGELIWGIPGMVLAIPLLGIAKVICDHIPALQPYGYLIGEEKKKEKGVTERLKKIFKK